MIRLPIPPRRTCAHSRESVIRITQSLGIVVTLLRCGICLHRWKRVRVVA